MFVIFQNHHKIHTPEQLLMADLIQKILNNQTKEVTEKENEQYLPNIIINKLDIFSKSIIEFAIISLGDQIPA